jgi:proline dehydrogenase
MGIIDKAIANSVTVIPRPVVRRISRRYIAGEELEDAIRAIRDLNEQGCKATVDVLGESTQSERDAAEMLDQYKRVIDALDEHGLESGISVKPTGLGITLDEDLCRRNLEEIVVYAGEKNRFVRVDMEDSPYTSATLELVLDVHEAVREHRGGDTGLSQAQPQGRDAPGRDGNLSTFVQGDLRRAA